MSSLAQFMRCRPSNRSLQRFASPSKFASSSFQCQSAVQQHYHHASINHLRQNRNRFKEISSVNLIHLSPKSTCFYQARHSSQRNQEEAGWPTNNRSNNVKSKGLIAGLKELYKMYKFAMADDPNKPKTDRAQEQIRLEELDEEESVLGKEERKKHHHLTDYQKEFATKRFTAAGITCAFITAASEATIAGLMKHAIDTISHSESVTSLAMISGSILSVYAVKGFATFVQEYSIESLVAVMVAKIRSKAHNHIISQPVSFFQVHKQGDLTSRLANDTTVIYKGLSSLSSEMILSPLRVIFLTAVIFYRSPLVALVAATLMPLSGVLVNRIGQLIRKHESKSQNAIGRLVSKMNETFQNMPFVIAYGLQDHVRHRFESSHNKLLKNQVRVAKYGAALGPFSEASSSLAASVVVFVGGIQVMQGNLTPGDLLSFLTALGMLYKPVKKLLSLNSQLQGCLAAYERVTEVMKDSLAESATEQQQQQQQEEEEQQQQQKEILLPKDKPFGISLKNVYFNYELPPLATRNGASSSGGGGGGAKGPIRYHIEDVSLDISPGELIIFVGGSGSGKSTLLHLIARLYEPQHGQIFFDDIAVKTIPRQHMHELLSLVHQKPIVWNDTLANNLRLGKLDATDEELMDALVKSNSDDFVLRLEHGINSHLGRHSLSIGQQQRLSLARALVSKAPLLLMDEVTSALDNQTEHTIYNTILKLRGQHTVIMVAHRLVYIAPYADKVVVLKDGRIVELGTHRELMEGTPKIGDGSIYRLLARGGEHHHHTATSTTTTKKHELLQEDTPTASTSTSTGVYPNNSLKEEQPNNTSSSNSG